jgi:hypothetical protein
LTAGRAIVTQEVDQRRAAQAVQAAEEAAQLAQQPAASPAALRTAADKLEEAAKAARSIDSATRLAEVATAAQPALEAIAQADSAIVREAASRFEFALAPPTDAEEVAALAAMRAAAANADVAPAEFPAEASADEAAAADDAGTVVE